MGPGSSNEGSGFRMIHVHAGILVGCRGTGRWRAQQAQQAMRPRAKPPHLRGCGVQDLVLHSRGGSRSCQGQVPRGMEGGLRSKLESWPGLRQPHGETVHAAKSPVLSPPRVASHPSLLPAGTPRQRPSVRRPAGWPAPCPATMGSGHGSASRQQKGPHTSGRGSILEGKVETSPTSSGKYTGPFTLVSTHSWPPSFATVGPNQGSSAVRPSTAGPPCKGGSRPERARGWRQWCSAGAPWPGKRQARPCAVVQAMHTRGEGAGCRPAGATGCAGARLCPPGPTCRHSLVCMPTGHPTRASTPAALYAPSGSS